MAGQFILYEVPCEQPDNIYMIQCSTQKALSLWHTRRFVCDWCIGFWLRYILASWKDATWEIDYQRWKKVRLNPQPEESAGQARLCNEGGTPASDSGGHY